MAADSQWMAAIEERLKQGDERMGRIETGLAENTAATKDVLDVMEAAKTGFRVLGHMGTAAVWVGKLAAAGSAVWAAWYAITHGGKPPGGN